MCTEPVDADEYVRMVAEMANKQFNPQLREPDYKRYHVRDKELGRCLLPCEQRASTP